jgi:hypothetical protein
LEEPFETNPRVPEKGPVVVGASGLVVVIFVGTDIGTVLAESVGAA